MGYSNWSDAAYQSRQSYRQQTQQTAFTYDQQARGRGRERAMASVGQGSSEVRFSLG